MYLRMSNTGINWHTWYHGIHGILYNAACSDGASCISVCASCLLFCHWTSVKKAILFSLHCPFRFLHISRYLQVFQYLNLSRIKPSCGNYALLLYDFGWSKEIQLRFLFHLFCHSQWHITLGDLKLIFLSVTD